MNLQWIVAPLVGSVIGYITNWLAIKMLFRPFKPVYMGKWRVPLTPGLIPKEKRRLAESVGNVISVNLLSPQTVKDALLSEDMKGKLESGIDKLIETGRQDQRTLRELFASMSSDEAIDQGASSVKTMLVSMLDQKLRSANLGDLAAQAITDHVRKKSPSALASLVSGILDDRIKQSIMNQLADGVNHYIEQNAQGLLQGVVDSEADKLLNARLCDLAEQYKDNLPQLKARLMGLYHGLIETGTRQVLGAIDLSAIVQSKIMSFDDHELESLILGVVNRELNAIVWLGAGLGLIMGFTNLLFV